MTSHSSISDLEAQSAAERLSSERRKSARFALLIRAAKLIVEGREYLCVVRDASVDGLKIRYYGQFPESGNLRIGLSNGETFPVELVWKDEPYAGLRFQNEVDLTRIVSLSEGDMPKRKLRLNTDVAAELVCEGRIYPAVVKNLSQQGAGIECTGRLTEHQLIRLDIPGMPELFAKVRWRRGIEYGLVFETTLSFEQLADAVLRLNS